MNYAEAEVEDVTPQPEDFIRSIAEQGYRLETAIADLIDNSISADADIELSIRSAIAVSNL